MSLREFPGGTIGITLISLSMIGVFQKQHILVDNATVPEKSAKYPHNLLTLF